MNDKKSKKCRLLILYFSTDAESSGRSIFFAVIYHARVDSRRLLRKGKDYAKSSNPHFP